MKKIFITATNTDIGKTYSALKLIQALSNRGLKVGVFKPFETGVKDYPLDGVALYNECIKYNSDFKRFSIDDIVPYKFKLPASIYVAKDGTNIDLYLLKEQLNRFKNYCDVLLIEGAGGLFVPIEKNFFTIDLIDLFDAKTLLVADSKLGCINNTILNTSLLQARKIDFSWMINLRDDDFYEISYPFLRDYFGDVYTLQKDIEKVIDSLIL